MKKISIAALLALIMVFSGIVAGTTVNAQTTEEPTTTTSTTSKRCTIAQGRLNIRIAAVETVKTKQTKTYNELLARFETRIDTAQKNEYDVTEMTKARDEVKAKVEIFTQKNTALANALMATKNLSCGNSDGAFATSLAASRTALLETRAAAKDVRTTFREKVIPSLKAYATWINEQKQTEDNK